MNSIINQLRGVSFYLHALILCISILFENKIERGVKSLEHFLCMGCLIFSPQYAFCCAPWAASTTEACYMLLNSCQLFSGCSSAGVPNTKKTKKKQVPLTGFTVTHTRNSLCFAWQDLQMETGGIFSKQVNIKQAQSESNPAQTKSWTSESCGSKLKVWLLVEIGLSEVTSGKCLCLTHFTAYSQLTSDFLTGSTAFILVYLLLL